MKTQMYYNLPFNENIASVLEEHGIKYNHYDFGIERKSPYMSFYIFKEDSVWDVLKDTLPKKDAHRLFFTDEELSCAKWLMVRSTNMKIDSLNENTYDYTCPEATDRSKRYGAHQRQIAPFEFKPVKWTTNNHFYACYDGGYYTIFCDDLAKSIIEDNRFVGMRFDDIIWHKKNCILPNVHQMVFETVLPRESIVLDDHVREVACKGCGKIQYFYTNDFRLGIKEMYLSEGVDFYSTPAMFGEGGVYELSIVSQQVYRTLKDHKMTRNLCFEPVVLY